MHGGLDQIVGSKLVDISSIQGTPGKVLLLPHESRLPGLEYVYTPAKTKRDEPEELPPETTRGPAVGWTQETVQAIKFPLSNSLSLCTFVFFCVSMTVY